MKRLSSTRASTLLGGRSTARAGVHGGALLHAAPTSLATLGGATVHRVLITVTVTVTMTMATLVMTVALVLARPVHLTADVHGADAEVALATVLLAVAPAAELLPVDAADGHADEHHDDDGNEDENPEPVPEGALARVSRQLLALLKGHVDVVLLLPAISYTRSIMGLLASLLIWILLAGIENAVAVLLAGAALEHLLRCLLCVDVRLPYLKAVSRVATVVIKEKKGFVV